MSRMKPAGHSLSTTALSDEAAPKLLFFLIIVSRSVNFTQLRDAITDDANNLAYKTAKKQAKREVTKARSKAYEELCEQLERKERENELFKIAKQRNRQSKNVQQVRVMRSKIGEMLMEKEKVKQRWKEYFDNLLNQENPRERRETNRRGRYLWRRTQDWAEED